MVTVNALTLFDRKKDRYFSNETDEAHETKFEYIYSHIDSKWTTTTKIIVILSSDKNYRESSGEKKTALHWIAPLFKRRIKQVE